MRDLWKSQVFQHIKINTYFKKKFNVCIFRTWTCIQCAYLKILNLFSSKKVFFFFFLFEVLVPWFDPSINSTKKVPSQVKVTSIWLYRYTCTLTYKEPANTGLKQVTHARKNFIYGTLEFYILILSPTTQKNKQTNPPKKKKNLKKKRKTLSVLSSRNKQTNPKNNLIFFKKKKKVLSVLSLQQQTDKQTQKIERKTKYSLLH